MSKNYIWSYFKEKIGNEYGVAALMGNLQAESGLHCDRVQGDIPYSSYSQEYTAKVDLGEISEHDFVYNAPGGGGYGLAQWTFWSRKQALYDMYKSGGYSSIGSVELACDYLWYELQNSFPTVLSALKNATSIREASDIVLHDFESPADQSEAVEEKRTELGQAIYDELSGTGGEPEVDPELLKNDAIIASAIEWAVGIANDDSHGYDQDSRWGLDYDCSSLVIQAYEQAGCPVKTNGATYTGNMESVFSKTGFAIIVYSEGMELVRGDVLWRTGHTEMYIGNGQKVGAHINELGEVVGGQVGDQTGNEISVNEMGGSWDLVFRLPSTGGTGDTPIVPEPPEPPTEEKKKSLSKLLLFAMALDKY